MQNQRRETSGRIVFINARSCGCIQQLDLLDRYLMELDAEYAAISDPRLTATSPLGSKNYELFADEKSRYHVCFAVRRRQHGLGGDQPEMLPITERAVALFIPQYRVQLLVVYGMPMTKTHTDDDRRASWAELHSKIFEHMRDAKCPILAGGDLNAHISAKQLRDGGHPERCKCVTKSTDANGRAVLELCKALQMTILNYADDQPRNDYTTYMGNAVINSSTVDYVCVSADARGRLDGAIRLTTGRHPYGRMTDHKGLMVTWKMDTAKRQRDAWTQRECPFSETRVTTPGSPEEKYELLVERIAKSKPQRKAGSGPQTRADGPSTQMQQLLDRRVKLGDGQDDKVREVQLYGIDQEIAALSVREERSKWDAVEKEIQDACSTGRTGNILQVIEKFFGAPKRKLHVPKKNQDALLAHMKSVVSPEQAVTHTEPEVSRWVDDMLAQGEGAPAKGPQTGAENMRAEHVEEWGEVKDRSAAVDVYADASYGMVGATHQLAWAVVTEAGRRLYCGPVPFDTFGAQEPTIRNGEDWAIMEAMARTQMMPVRCHTDSLHSVKEHQQWGKLVRSEFQATMGGDALILRTMHGFMRGRRVQVVHEEGHTVGTLNYMAHVGARYAAQKGEATCVMEMPVGMTWEIACKKHTTESALWKYMDTWCTATAGDN